MRKFLSLQAVGCMHAEVKADSSSVWNTVLYYDEEKII